jgi:hypothetical protein
MSTVESLPGPAEESVTAPAFAGYEITLEKQPNAARMVLVGVLNDYACDAIGGIISCTGPVPCTIEVAADDVSSVDAAALETVVAGARERHQHGLPAVLLTSAGAALLTALHRLGLSTELPIALGGPSSGGSAGFGSRPGRR